KRLLPGLGKLVEEGFGLDRGECGPAGEEAGEQAGKVRGGEAAARYFFSATAKPGDFEVLAAGGEFNHLAKPAEEGFRLIGAGKVDRNDGGEMAGPFTPEEILVVAGSDNMPAQEIGFVNPIFIEENLVFAAAAEAAVEDVVTALERLAHSFPDDECAR